MTDTAEPDTALPPAVQAELEKLRRLEAETSGVAPVGSVWPLPVRDEIINRMTPSPGSA